MLFTRDRGQTIYKAILRSVLPAGICLVAACLSHAQAFSSNATSVEDLEYRTVLFEFYQGDYFSALIENKYAQSLDNPRSLNAKGRLLEGGMMLSYGLADGAEELFNNLLASHATLDVQNRAWFYLAKLHYSKSDLVSAVDAVGRIEEPVPADLLVDYHYLATLLRNGESPTITHAGEVEAAAQESPYFPYFVFNLGVAHLKSGNLVAAVTNLERVAQHSEGTGELAVLADRARHGLAELAMRSGNLAQAWSYLTNIRTTGLYSNRALLSYVWAAIQQDQFDLAIPALELLNQRSIALPEVQEGKVLLAHVYEQDGQLKKALHRNLRAEKEFAEGITLLSQARAMIAAQDVPREFISNLEAIMDDTDWYAAKPSVDYQKLTPFLIDLMSTHVFTETLRELADLYVIEDNLTFWSNQAEQHRLILDSAEAKSLPGAFDTSITRSQQLKANLAERKKEIELYALVLDEEERSRLDALLETTANELAALDDKVKQLSAVETAYEQPDHFRVMVRNNHDRILTKLGETERQILALEKIMRRLIDQELDKHEERMNYYLAQSRLAKARLYDMTLLSLERGVKGPANPASAGSQDKSADSQENSADSQENSAAGEQQ